MTVEEGRATVAITLPMLQASPPTPAQSYMVVAEALTSSISTLAASQGLHPLGLTVLCGQALECALKAFLCGYLDPDPIKRLNHDLRKAWEAAAARGLGIPVSMPHWAQSLHGNHARPHRARYAEGLNGFGFGCSDEMSSEVVRIVRLVRSHISRGTEAQ